MIVFLISGVSLNPYHRVKSFHSLLMAQSLPFSDVALDLKRQRSDETIHSQAAKAAITAMAVKLCDGMDSMSVALELHTKGLVSDNTLEEVRELQEVKEAKNSRILQSVKCAITVAGLQGFQDFLSVLGKFQLLRSLVTDLQGVYVASVVLYTRHVHTLVLLVLTEGVS